MKKPYSKKLTVSYHDDLIEWLKDQNEAMAYLQVALEEYEIDSDYQAFMLALRHLVEAQGRVTRY